MTDEEIRRMVKDAEAHSDEDKNKRERADARNRADQMVFETEKGLQEYGDKLDSETKAKVQAAVARVKEAVKTDNSDEMKSATQALTQTWHEAAGKMYQKTQTGARQAQGANAHAGQTQGKKDGKDQPVDADYEVVS
jgi:molecular chaperone DnaK